MMWKYNRAIINHRNLILLLLIITALVFGSVLGFEFLNFDDKTFILRNPVVADLQRNWTDCLKYNYKQSDYFPFTFLIWRWLRIVFDFNPIVFHFFNLLFHMLNVVLVYLFAVRVVTLIQTNKIKTNLVAFFIAFAFAVHPLHVESVAWVIDLKDILFTTFYLSGMLCYWQWIDHKKKSHYAFSILFGLLSILTKSTAITFIAAIFWIDWIRGKQFDLKKLLLNKLPFLLITILGFFLFGIVDSLIHRLNGTHINDPVLGATMYPEVMENMHWIIQKICIAAFRIFFWAKQTFIPLNQTIFYPRKSLLAYYESFILILPAMMLGGFWALYYLRKKVKLLWPSLVLFVILISPALFQADNRIAVFVPDRYMYLPLLGLLLMSASVLVKLNHYLALAIVSVLLLFWISVTSNYLPSWKSSEVQYNYCLKIDPHSTEALLNRSAIYVETGREDQALADLDTLIKVAPNHAAYSNRGKIFAGRLDYSKALQDFNRSLKAKPANFAALSNRGMLYLQMDSLELARKDFSEAYMQDSTNLTLLRNIGNLYNKAGNYSVALEFAQKCLALNSEDIDALRIKGVSLYFTGAFEESIDVYNKIISSNKTYGDTWYFRSLAKYKLNDIKGAKEDLELARSLDYPIKVEYESLLFD